MKYIVLLLILLLGAIALLYNQQPQPTIEVPHIRVWNQSEHDFENVMINFESQIESYGDIDANSITEFHKIAEVYPHPSINLNVNGKTLSTPIVDYMGGTLLEPGYYTYILNLNEDQTVEQDMKKVIFSVETYGCEGCFPSDKTKGIYYAVLNFYEDGRLVEHLFDRTIFRDEQYNPNIVEDVVEGIEQLDFEYIRSLPYDGQCPVMVDGPEYVYRFYTAEGIEVLSNCEHTIDRNFPPFNTIIGDGWKIMGDELN